MMTVRPPRGKARPPSAIAAADTAITVTISAAEVAREKPPAAVLERSDRRPSPCIEDILVNCRRARVIDTQSSGTRLLDVAAMLNGN
jgi:hypothetical protein